MTALTTEDRDRLRLQRVLDMIGRPVAGLRVLDLAARVGAFSVPLDAAGAMVVAVEGRSSNIAGMPPSPVEVVEADVRALSRLGIGTFDVVLCLGVLYHLGKEDALRLLADVAAATRPYGVAIVDTHVSTQPGGHTVPDDDSPWGSIGNAVSTWLHPEQITEVLSTIGPVAQVPGKAYPDEPDSRAWFVARREAA